MIERLLKILFIAQTWVYLIGLPYIAFFLLTGWEQIALVIWWVFGVLALIIAIMKEQLNYAAEMYISGPIGLAIVVIRWNWKRCHNCREKIPYRMYLCRHCGAKQSHTT